MDLVLLTDEARRPEVAVAFMLGHAQATDLEVVVNVGWGWQAVHRLDGSGDRLRPVGDVEYRRHDRLRRKVPPRIEREGRLSLLIRQRVRALLADYLADGSAARDDVLAGIERAAGTLPGEQAERLVKVMGFYETLRDRRQSGAVDLLPTSRAGRPRLTRSQLEDAEVEAKRQHGDTARDHHVAEQLGVHEKSLPRVRRRLGIRSERAKRRQ